MTSVPPDQVYAIADEVFTAMIDAEPGHLRLWSGEVPPPVAPLAAWVDVHGELDGRAAVTCEASTAHDLARALLGMPADEPVSRADLVDAFGEVANVVGGNIKALLPDQGTLTLPQVADVVPPVAGAALAHELRLDWRGRAVQVHLWLFG